VTLDDTALAHALRDLAATAPDDPARLSRVHHLARRRRRRQRALGAGALAATLTAAGVGVDALASTGRGPAAVRPASGGAASGGAAPSGAAPVLPTCPSSPPQSREAAPATQAPPAVGEVFSAGGAVASPGTAASVTVAVSAGPLAGQTITLTIAPSSTVSVGDPTASAGQRAATGDQLHPGQSVKFSATRTGATTYVVGQLSAAGPPAGPPPKPAGGSSGAPPSLRGSAAVSKLPPGGAPPPPVVGDRFKVEGVVESSAAGSLTVKVTGGSLSGVVTFTLHCAPASPLVGKTVDMAGTRTGATTYEVDVLGVASP